MSTEQLTVVTGLDASRIKSYFFWCATHLALKKLVQELGSAVLDVEKQASAFPDFPVLLVTTLDIDRVRACIKKIPGGDLMYTTITTVQTDHAAGPHTSATHPSGNTPASDPYSGKFHFTKKGVIHKQPAARKQAFRHK